MEVGRQFVYALRCDVVAYSGSEVETDGSEAEMCTRFVSCSVLSLQRISKAKGVSAQ